MLKVENITVALGNRDVIKDVSFFVEKGEYVGIVGENGSGKSTLIKAILKQYPIKSGKIEFLDKNIKTGYLPQQMKTNNFPASVFEVVLSGCINRGDNKLFFSKNEKELALNNMARLEITNLKNKSFNALSGGEQQRVLLARAMCAGKDMLILDEPVTGLDPMVTQAMYNIIKKLNEESGITVVMVSHDIPAAAKYCSKIIHMDKTVRFFGTSKEYLESDIGVHFTGRCCENV